MENPRHLASVQPRQRSVNRVGTLHGGPEALRSGVAQVVNQHPWRVAIVDDEQNLRLAVHNLLGGTYGFSSIGCFENASEALAEIPRRPPDLVLMDICMPDLNGIECTKRLKLLLPNLKIVMLTESVDADLVDECVRAGADAYLTKPVRADHLLATLKFVIGSTWRKQQPRKTGGSSCGATPSESSWALTSRENDVMIRLAKGRLYKEIADELNTSSAVVHKLVHKIFLKLRAANKTEAINQWQSRLGN
jgi:DNA-binding NarL/FixJ family response regulator